MHRLTKISKKEKSISFQYGDIDYRRSYKKESPFTKRKLRLKNRYSEICPTFLRMGKQFYEYVFSNRSLSYIDRKQTTNPKNPNLPVSQNKQRFITTTEKLPGNPKEVQYSLNVLIDLIKAQLEENPESLFANANYLRDICLEEGYHIRTFKAFEQVLTWDQFLAVIDAIKINVKRNRFELLSALITQYADSCK